LISNWLQLQVTFKSNWLLFSYFLIKLSKVLQMHVADGVKSISLLKQQLC